MKKIEIMGEEWKLIETNKIPDCCDGETDRFQKTIKIRPADCLLSGDGASDEDKRSRYKEVLRHELVHVMLMESGLTEYTYDETLVEWIAMKFPYMEKLFVNECCTGYELEDEEGEMLD